MVYISWSEEVGAAMERGGALRTQTKRPTDSTDTTPNAQTQQQEPPEPRSTFNTQTRDRSSTARTELREDLIRERRQQNDKQGIHRRSKQTVKPAQCPKTDPDLRRETNNSTTYTYSKAWPLLIKWVLISTTILCAYTHLTALPKSHNYYQNTHLLPARYPHPALTTDPSPSNNATTKKNPTLSPLSSTSYSAPEPPTLPAASHAIPPTPTARPSHAPQQQAPPTPHHTKHTTVSPKNCTHHAQTPHFNKTQQNTHTLSVSLPSMSHYRHPRS